jgi:hypothetical protein
MRSSSRLGTTASAAAGPDEHSEPATAAPILHRLG